MSREFDWDTVSPGEPSRSLILSESACDSSPRSSQAEVMLVRNVLVFCSLSNMTPSISCFETTSQRDIWATQEGHQFLSDGNEFMCIFRARAQVDATRHFTMQA